MYLEVAEKLVVSSSGSFTRAFSMDGANTVSVTFEIVAFAANTIVTVQEGNDLQNWEDSDSSTTKTTVGSFVFSGKAIGSRYARLKITGSGTVLSACVETSLQ
jgi:hypothetical protein